MKWIDEKVFQKYFKESFKKYNSWVEKEYGEKLVSVRYNEPFDRYPDLWCVLESGKTIPVEVEWRTKDFNHDPQILVNQNGFIVVLQNNVPHFGIRQLECDETHFRSWYNKNSDKIFSESISKVITEKSRMKRPPKLWFYYSSVSSFKNREKTIESGVMGVPFPFRRLDKFKDIRKRDLFCFIGPIENFTSISGGRIPFDVFKKQKKITCKSLLLFSVTKEYYYDENKIWDFETKSISSERIRNYPHRINFNKNPILSLSNVPLKNLSINSKRDIQKLISTLFWEGSPDVLIDIISNSK